MDKVLFCQIYGFQLVSLLVLFFSVVHFYFITKSAKKKKNRERERNVIYMENYKKGRDRKMDKGLSLNKWCSKT